MVNDGSDRQFVRIRNNEIIIYYMMRRSVVTSIQKKAIKI